jgi:hypothetical protein
MASLKSSVEVRLLENFDSMPNLIMSGAARSEIAEVVFVNGRLRKTIAYVQLMP